MKTIIDISGEKKVVYTFADKRKTSIDIFRAKRVLQKIYLYLADFLEVETAPSSVTILRKNRRSCRIIVYNFKKLLFAKNIFIVVFYGNKREHLSPKFTKDFFHTDWEISMSLVNEKNILCYISQELYNGNWFNLVLFTKEDGKKEVVVKEKHAYAAYTLAPKRFSWVRLHNAILPNGLEAYKNIILTKTKYYNFDDMWFAMRRY